MRENDILLVVDSGLAQVTLNRPERGNAFDAFMRTRLKEVFERIDSDSSIKSVLVQSTAKIFSSGQDLSEPCMNPSLDGTPADVGQLLHDEYNPLIQRIYRCMKPIVCAVNGPAIGGGVSLSLACDFVLASHSARFILPHCSLGLTLDAGSSFFIGRALSPARASQMSLLNDGIDAHTALEWGFIWKVVPDDQLLSEATSAFGSIPACAGEPITVV